MTKENQGFSSVFEKVEHYRKKAETRVKVYIPNFEHLLIEAQTEDDLYRFLTDLLYSWNSGDEAVEVFGERFKPTAPRKLSFEVVQNEGIISLRILSDGEQFGAVHVGSGWSGREKLEEWKKKLVEEQYD